MLLAVGWGGVPGLGFDAVQRITTVQAFERAWYLLSRIVLASSKEGREQMALEVTARRASDADRRATTPPVNPHLPLDPMHATPERIAAYLHAQGPPQWLD